MKVLYPGMLLLHSYSLWAMQSLALSSDEIRKTVSNYIARHYEVSRSEEDICSDLTKHSLTYIPSKKVWELDYNQRRYSIANNKDIADCPLSVRE